MLRLRNPPREGYHDRQWAAKMKEVGLQPTDTGKPGRQGDRPEGLALRDRGRRFRQIAHEAAGRGFKLRWQSRTAEDDSERKKGRQQDEIHLPRLRRERMGQARDSP